MEKKTSSRFTYTKLHHVGVVVRDIDKAIAYLESIGIGPFEAWDGQKVGSVKFNGKLHGKSATWTTKVSHANLPEVQVELLVPSEGNQALKESLDKTGEGLHHIGFITDDLDKEISQLEKAGLKIWTEAREGQGAGFIYTEPTPVAGIAVEFRSFGKPSQ